MGVCGKLAGSESGTGLEDAFATPSELCAVFRLGTMCLLGFISVHLPCSRKDLRGCSEFVVVNNHGIAAPKAPTKGWVSCARSGVTNDSVIKNVALLTGWLLFFFF